MHTRYRVSFRIADTTEPRERLAELCCAWRSIPLGEATQLAKGGSFRHGNEVIQTSFLVTDDRDQWALRLLHPDVENGDAQWITDVGLCNLQGSAWISVAVGLRVPGDLPAGPVNRRRTRPRIVADVLREFGSPDPIGPTPRVIESDHRSIFAFVEELKAPTRLYPIVLVSCRNSTDRPVTDCSRLADWLCGYAAVVQTRSGATSRALGQLLPPALNCWDGAVRLYWPGFGRFDRFDHHRVWRPESVLEADCRQGSDGFRGLLLGRMSELLALRAHHHAVTVDDIELERRTRESARALIEARELSSASGDQTEYVSLLEGENQQLAKRLMDAEGRLRKLETEQSALLRRLEDRDVEVQYWREQSQGRGLGRQADNPDETEDEPPDSTRSAVLMILGRYPDRIAVSLNSQSDDDTPYAAPEEVAKALEWLATTYHEARAGKTSVPDLNESIRTSVGAHWFWKGGQSATTMGAYPNHYRCTFDGRQLAIEEHIGAGVSKRPDQTIRIAFAWMDERELVVIGFIGQHQRNRNT